MDTLLLQRLYVALAEQGWPVEADGSRLGGPRITRVPGKQAIVDTRPVSAVLR